MNVNKLENNIYIHSLCARASRLILSFLIGFIRVLLLLALSSRLDIMLDSLGRCN